MIDKIRNRLGLLILALYPIMQFINFGGIKFNVSITDFLIPVYFILCLLGVKRFPIKKNLPFVAYFLLYGFVVLISNYYNFSSGVGTYGMAGLLSELVKIATCFGYFIVAYNSFEDEKSFSHVMLAWLVGLWIFMIYGFINLHGRFIGTFTDANGAGNYLTFSFFVMILLLFRIKSDIMRALVYFTEMMILLCILATQSRGTWVGMAVGLFLLIVVFWRKLFKLLGIFLLLFVIAALLFVKLDFDRDYTLSRSITNQLNEAVKGERQFIIRKNLSIQSLMMGKDHPLIGVGKGNFNLNSMPYADLLYDKSKDSFIYGEMTRSIPHNTFAGILAELGVFGLAIFSSMFLLLVFKLFKRRTALNGILWIALLTFGIQSLVLCLENARVLWIFLALGFRLQDVELALVGRNEEEQVLSKEAVNKGTIVLAVVTVALFLYTASHVTKFTEINDTATVYEIPYQQGLKITYNIKSAPNHGTAPLSYVKVYKNTIDGENLIESRIYLDTEGYEFIDLTSMAAERIQIVFEREKGGGDFEIRNLYYEFVDGTKHSLMDYALVPNVVERYLPALLHVRAYDQNEIITVQSPVGKNHLMDYLKALDEDKLILVSVKDEASNSLDGATVAAFRNFGIDFNLPYKWRFSYVAIFSKAAGFKSFEALSETVAKGLEFNFARGTFFGSYQLPFDLELTSAGFQSGDYSSIKLDGIEYSQQRRGLNIVVYDMKENLITDAFVVDTCVSSFY